MAPEVNVWFRGKWYGPSYPDAGDLPAEPAAQRSAEPSLSSAETSAGTSDSQPSGVTPPPKAGPGSSRAKWVAYAEANNVEVPDGADRDDIIAALRDAGVAVDQPDD